MEGFTMRSPAVKRQEQFDYQEAVSRRTPVNQGGWSILEVLISMTVLTIGVVSFLMALTNSMRLAQASHENDVAMNAARQMIERMQRNTFSDIFALYNEDSSDDPGGAGTAPGPNFAVDRLNLLPDDTDGMVGKIIFPTIGNQLREDQTQALLGLSYDLDLDGDKVRGDSDDHANDYIMLPVKVQLEWRSVTGDWVVEMKAMLVER